MVRDFTKWDDTPVSLRALRRIRRARLQDRDDAAHGAGGAGGRHRAPGEGHARRTDLRIPKLSLSTPPAGDSGAVAEAAQASGGRRKSADRGRTRRAHAARA